jgi:hypothetical protein
MTAMRDLMPWRKPWRFGPADTCPDKAAWQADAAALPLAA